MYYTKERDKNMYIEISNDRFKTENNTVKKEIISPLLESIIKNELKFNNDSSYILDDKLPEGVFLSLSKRLDAPLPLDKTFVYNAINEANELSKNVENKKYIFKI